MSKTQRLMQAMQYLRSHRAPIRAEDLAAALDISLRSAYRDIDALRGAGAIIDGAAGYGYTLVEDPALPPMMFSQDEMEALVLGLKEVQTVADPVLAAAAQNAYAKLAASLPPRQKMLFENTVLHAKRFHHRPDIHIDIAALRQAARDEFAVDIDYADAQGVASQRRVLPLSIVFMDKALVLLAYCELRQDYRAFRLDRITRLGNTKASFRPRRVVMLRAAVAKLTA